MSKTVLITGSSTGIGAASALRMANAGWKVYAGVRKLADGDDVVAKAGNAEVVPIVLDVTKDEQIVEALDQIRDQAGSLDGLVNNAGIAVGGPIEMLRDDEWRHQFDVNFFGVVSLTRQAMPLVSQASGRFVHIGSVAGRVAGAGLGPYSASKHAIEAFNWSLRAELARNTKMTSSVIEPGEVSTPIWDKANDTIRDLTERMDRDGLRERYGFLLDGQQGFIEEGQNKGISPDKVAEAVEHALTSSRPKARYLVGPDAKGVGVLSRLPDRALEAALNFNQKRLEKSAKSARK